MRTARRFDEHWGIGRSAAETVKTVWIRAEDGGVTIQTDFGSPFIRVAPARKAEVLLHLKQVAVGAEDRAAGRIESLEQAISISDGRLCVVDRGEEWRTPDVAQGRLRNHMRRNVPYIADAPIPLVIEKLHSKTRIDDHLVRIGLGTGEPGSS